MKITRKKRLMNNKKHIVIPILTFGTDEVIPNNQQLMQWTINRIVSGDRAVLARVEALC